MLSRRFVQGTSQRTHLHAVSTSNLVQGSDALAVLKQRIDEPRDEGHLVLQGCEVHGGAAQDVPHQQQPWLAGLEQQIHTAQVASHDCMMQCRPPFCVLCCCAVALYASQSTGSVMRWSPMTAATHVLHWARSTYSAYHCHIPWNLFTHDVAQPSFIVWCHWAEVLHTV